MSARHANAKPKRILIFLSCISHGGAETQDALLSTRREGMPNGVMEYRYRGLPGVATDIPGVREVVGSGNAQRLVPVGGASGLQRRIPRLAGDGALRRKLGIANRRRSIDEFDVDKIMPLWTRLLDGLHE